MLSPALRKWSATCWAMAALTVVVLAAEPASAIPITKELTVKVVTVCNDSGFNCASKGPAGNLFFEAETDKIWAQAGIGVTFVEMANRNSTNLSDLNESVFGKGLFNLAPPSSTVVTMFLVHTISGAYGEGWAGFGGLAIAMDTVMDFNPGIGRLDTIAHELGHNLGLVPSSLGGVGFHDLTHPNYLMATGGSFRNIPNSLEQICPDGPCYDLLPQAHIDFARDSGLLTDTPEPATLLLFGTTAAGLGLVRWRQKRGRKPQPC
jgi:hypothetical protein